MKEDALSYREDFHSISFGDPLLTSEQDSLDVIQAIADEFSSLKEDQVLVLMGHGTTHFPIPFTLLWTIHLKTKDIRISSLERLKPTLPWKLC